MLERSLRLRGRIAAYVIVVVAIALAVLAYSALAHESDLTAPARREARLVIYSTTDDVEAAELLSAFRHAYPYIQVDYQSLTAREVYSRFRSEMDAGKPGADLVISSAMDLQIKLVNDRYAQAYDTPERRALPEWAVWKNQAFAISAEPIVFGYNPALLPAGEAPKSHDELASFLRREPSLAGRIGSYDLKGSPTGYLYLTQDVQTDRDAWELIGAIGRAQPKLYVSSKTMISDVSAGKLTLAYNVIGSYAFERAATDPNFKVIVPRDYVLMMSRVALISARAPHPASAKLFLNFLLSKQGQALLAKHHMTPVRRGMEDRAPELDRTNVRAVKVGPGLMAGIDTMTFARFTKRWAELVQSTNEYPNTEGRI
jgi:iron(III) transport system substrate-binding protein